MMKLQLAADDSAKKTVRLTIDYGDGMQKVYSALKWSRDMTIQDVLESARRHARGITFKVRGSGTIALLTQIDDLKNEGGRGSNWIYWINNELGDESFANARLKANDHVLWKFGSYE